VFVDDATILQLVSDRLQAAGVANLPTWWASTVLTCHQWAYNEIVAALAARGFSAAQIAAFDRGKDVEIDLSIFRSLSAGGSLANYDDKFIRSFDRRGELKEMAVLNGGAWQYPTESQGTVGSGTMDTNSDLIVLDPDDPRLGRTTHW
jgi:hypothetical protein